MDDSKLWKSGELVSLGNVRGLVGGLDVRSMLSGLQIKYCAQVSQEMYTFVDLRFRIIKLSQRKF